MQLFESKGRIIKDFLINIIATVIPVALLQLIIFPLIADKNGEESYGYIVTMISLMTLFSDSVGNVLNNVRLLQDNKYKEQGDFNVILVAGAIFNILAICIGYTFYDTGEEGIFGVLIASLLILARAYYIVAFRLRLNFKNILFNNLFLALGYIVGFSLFYLLNNWTLIYICGNIFSLIHIFFKSHLMRERLTRTIRFKETLRKFVVLYIAFFMKTVINYADKLLIFPLLGAEAVAHYYAASVMGKLLSMAISPISSVILSYVAKTDSINKKTLRKYLSVLIVVSAIGYVLTYVVGRFLLAIFYNSWFEETVDLLPWTVLASILGGVGSVLQPIILKFKNETYQIMIYSVHVTVYIVVSLLLIQPYGLIGFCVGYSITLGLKLIVDLILLNTIGKGEESVQESQ